MDNFEFFLSFFLLELASFLINLVCIYLWENNFELVFLVPGQINGNEYNLPSNIDFLKITFCFAVSHTCIFVFFRVPTVRIFNSIV